MLEFYFSYRGVLKRLRSGALGAEMDRIAADLHSRGYKPASAKLYLSRIARFSHFAAERCGSKPISATIVDRYLRALGAGSPRIAAVTAMQHARRVVPNRFVPVPAKRSARPKRAALYIRVSTAEQNTANQRRELQAVAERHGWEVVAVFEDAGISGAKGRDHRPGLDAMLKAIARREIDMVAA